MLIILEGIDGAGKSTQAEILAKGLREKGKMVAVFKFPHYQSFFGAAVKKLLAGAFGTVSTLNPYLVSTLYALNRFENKAKLLSLLQKNDIVIVQRYVTSNLLYQSAQLPSTERQRLWKWIERMEYAVFGLPRPDAVIYLYIPAALAHKLINRRGKRKELYEREMRILNRVNMLARKRASDKKWFMISCSRDGKVFSRSKIARDIWNSIGEIIN